MQGVASGIIINQMTPDYPTVTNASQVITTLNYNVRHTIVVSSNINIGGENVIKIEKT